MEEFLNFQQEAFRIDNMPRQLSSCMEYFAIALLVYRDLPTVHCKQLNLSSLSAVSLSLPWATEP